MGEGNFWPPQNPHPLTAHKKFVASDYVGDRYGCAKFGANPSTGGRGVFCANGWNITKILFMCLFYFMMTQTMWTCARMCLLGVSLILLPILGWYTPDVKFKFLNFAKSYMADRRHLVNRKTALIYFVITQWHYTILTIKQQILILKTAVYPQTSVWLTKDEHVCLIVGIKQKQMEKVLKTGSNYRLIVLVNWQHSTLKAST